MVLSDMPVKTVPPGTQFDITDNYFVLHVESATEVEEVSKCLFFSQLQHAFFFRLKKVMSAYGPLFY